MLHEKLDEVLGPDDAAVMMSLLPPVGWADVATKRDLDKLRSEFRADLAHEIGGLRTEMHEGFGSIRGEMQAGQRQLFFAIIGSQFTAVSLAFAAMALAG